MTNTPHAPDSTKPRPNAVNRAVLAEYLQTLLDTARIKDVAPHGLQVEGRAQIRRIVLGVTANKALIDAAASKRADAILVHHGLFWKGDAPQVVGFHRERLKALLAADINLFAYHLPLDIHPSLGNNAEMGRMLGFDTTARVGELGLVNIGTWAAKPAASDASAEALTAHLAAHYGAQVALIASASRPINTVAWCSGGAGSMLVDAANAGADAYITGEVNEQHVHIARELGIALITAGHHATERGGVQALGEHLAERFGVEVIFVDIPSPI